MYFAQSSKEERSKIISLPAQDAKLLQILTEKEEHKGSVLLN